MATLDLLITDDADDGSWTENNSGFSSVPAYLGGFISSTPGYGNGFLRFHSITIPPGSTINSAVITGYAQQTISATTVNSRISAIAADNAAAPTTYAGAEGATRTTAYVDWNNIGSFSNESPYDTPDIATVVQEIIDRGGWASGNAIVFYTEDNGSTASSGRHRAFRGVSTGYPAELHIDYTAPASGQPARKRMGGVAHAYGGYDPDNGIMRWRHTQSGLILPNRTILQPDNKLAV